MDGIDLRDTKKQVNLKGFTLAGAEMAAQALIGNYVGMLSPLFRAFGAITKDDSLEVRLSRLFFEALTYTILHTLPKLEFRHPPPTPAQIQDILVASLQQIAERMNDEPRIFKHADLINPELNEFTKLSFAIYLHHADKLGFLEDKIALTPLLAFDFNSAFRRFFTKRYSYYKTLETYFSSDLEKANTRDAGWMKYNETIISRFDASSLFGEEEDGVKISQVYLNLRFIWDELGEDETANGDFTGEKQIIRKHCGMLDEELDRWLTSYVASDSLRLISGGPGSGKSTFAKRLAAKYAAKGGWKVLFVPLQRLGSGR